MGNPTGPVSEAGETGRFAPSTTGLPHPGTLLAALLCWLDIRSRGGLLCLRLEDLDPDRCRPEYADAMRRDLAWLGLDWDTEVLQSECSEGHEAALDRLADQGRLYPCSCSRSALRALDEFAPDGGPRYPGTCRDRRLPPVAQGGWRSVKEPLRVRLPETRVEVLEESGLDLSQSPAITYGDPVVRRRDGAVAYHLASVVDDAAEAVSRIIRGRDLAPSTPVQGSLAQLLGLKPLRYRHHLLLLERRERKWSKFHKAVDTDILRTAYDGPALCGLLAYGCELMDSPTPITPTELLATFRWPSVRQADRRLDWDGGQLLFPEP